MPEVDDTDIAMSASFADAEQVHMTVDEMLCAE